MRSRWPLRLLALALSLFASVAVSTAPAGAHAYLTYSEPADGAVLASAPKHLLLRFSESVDLASTRIDVVGSGGRTVAASDISAVSANGDSTAAGGDTIVAATLPPLPPDAYRVSWETVSSDDLHRTAGILVFGVQHAVGSSGLHEPAPDLTESFLRWWLLLGLALALGGTLLDRLYRAGDRDTAAERAAARSRALALIGSVAAVAVSGVLLAEQMSAGHQSLHRLLSSGYGTRWLVREAGLGLLVLVLLVRLRGRRRLRGLTVLAAAMTGAGCALLGHAGAGADISPTRVAADAAHVVAAAVWCGTVLVAAVVTLPRLRGAAADRAAARAALRRFRRPALTCLAVMVVTGVYLASSVVGSVDALLLTTYGRVLCAKLVVATLAVWFAWRNSTALHGRRTAGATGTAGTTGAPRHLGREALAGATVLALVGVLTSAQPAREPQLVRSVASQPQPVADGSAADLQETLAVSPDLPGANVVLVGVFDTRRPAPAPVRTVDVTFAGPDGAPAAPVTLTALPDGRWSAPVSLATPGSQQVRVTVHRPGMPDAVATYRWTVGGSPSVTRPARVSTAPLAGPLQALAGLLAAVACLVQVVVLLVARRRRRAVPAPSPLLAAALEDANEDANEEVKEPEPAQG